MARSFTSKDAATLIDAHKELRSNLRHVQDQAASIRGEVKQAADAMVAEAVMEVLRGVPIEELNRDKRAIKIKALRERGYETIADIAPASVYQIASIHGISEDTARTIRRIADNLISQAHRGIHIRISEDRKTSASTAMLIRLSSLRKSIPLSKQAGKLQSAYDGGIARAIADLQPGTSGLRWLFASRDRKQRSEEAYAALKEWLGGEYGRQAREIADAAGRAQSVTADEAWQDFRENSIRLLALLEAIVPGLLGADDAVYGLPEDLARAVRDESLFPDGLRCALRRYQEWGVKYILHQGRVLLGDEMGLGKTVQAIAAMVSLKNTGASHFVVVCPASVLANWCREIADKSSLGVTKVHGPSRESALQAWAKTGGVAVTTYETTAYFKLDAGFRFSLLVVDEAHYIKNAEARRTINVKEIAAHADRLLFMTGTALENRVDEMVSLIQILQPSVAMEVRGMEFLASAPQFRERVAPVYYRRKREDVLKELPEMIENREWCTLLPEEEALYEDAVLTRRYSDARRVSWSVDDLSKSSKAARMLEIIEEAESEGRKVIVFSFFLDTIRKVVQLLGSRCVNPINGSVSPTRRQEIIDEFDRAPAGTVLAAQIQSGGTGLNIQSASVVILCEPQFKPSIENQAISRAYRMGQTRNVLVYRLLCENTVDEKILALLEEKQAIFDAFADKSEAASMSVELDETSFGDIIQSEIDRINARKRLGEGA